MWQAFLSARDAICDVFFFATAILNTPSTCYAIYKVRENKMIVYYSVMMDFETVWNSRTMYLHYTREFFRLTFWLHYICIIIMYLIFLLSYPQHLCGLFDQNLILQVPTSKNGYAHSNNFVNLAWHVKG